MSGICGMKTFTAYHCWTDIIQ